MDLYFGISKIIHRLRKIFQHFLGVQLKIFHYILITATIFLISCGKEAQEAKQAFDILKDLPEKAQKMEQQADLVQKKQEERRQRGDTLAMPYQKLQEFLPKNISEYGDAKLSGESMNWGGFSMSKASANFYKEQPDGKTKNLSIELIDYNENYGLYAGLIFWSAGYSREDEYGFERTFNPGFENVWALEKFEKQDGTAELVYAISYRFLMTLRADNQKDTEFLKSVAKKVDIAKLAKL